MAPILISVNKDENTGEETGTRAHGVNSEIDEACAMRWHVCSVMHLANIVC